MIEALISSKTRIKLLLKFFLNSRTTAYLRGLEAEFGESTNAIRVELNRFEKAGLLQSFTRGNKKIFQANTQHPLFGELHSILLKHIGVDAIIEDITNRLGAVSKAYLAGSFAQGKDSQIIDLLIIGKPDRNYLIELIDKVERKISRKIRYVIYPSDQDIKWETFQVQPVLIWSKS